MLVGYFDESGEHDNQTGSTVRLTLAGCLAKPETWEEFSAEWSGVLKAEDLRMFHMVDFESRRNEFKDWQRPRRERVLNALLDIMVRHIRIYAAFTNTSKPGRKRLRRVYQKGVLDAIFQATNFAEGVSLIFARQDELSLESLKKDYGSFGPFRRKLQACDVGEPLSTYPLQAADLFAYEAMKWAKHGSSRQTRYPLQRLRGNGEMMIISWQ